MPIIQVERKDDGRYRALQNHKTIATGDTQREAAENARDKRPHDTIEVERVRDTSGGSRDKWRRWKG
jgi:hypothetical protein